MLVVSVSNIKMLIFGQMAEILNKMKCFDIFFRFWFLVGFQFFSSNFCLIMQLGPNFTFCIKNGHKVAVVRASPKLTNYRQKTVVSHQRSFSIEGVFHQRSSSIKGGLPSKVVFHQRSSSIKEHLPSKVIFH